jgi:hypothetical protein
MIDRPQEEVGFMGRIKTFSIWVVIGGILYFFLHFHLIFIDNTIKLLKKSKLTFNYTVFSAKGKPNAMILSREELREDGIGDLLVEMGKMSEEEYERLLMKYEDSSDY